MALTRMDSLNISAPPTSRIDIKARRGRRAQPSVKRSGDYRGRSRAEGEERTRKVSPYRCGSSMGSARIEPAGVRARVQQRCAKLGALHALVAYLAVRQLAILGGRIARQVRGRVREPRLLAEQQEQGKQQVHHGTAGVHGVRICAASERGFLRGEV